MTRPARIVRAIPAAEGPSDHYSYAAEATVSAAALEASLPFDGLMDTARERPAPATSAVVMPPPPDAVDDRADARPATDRIAATSRDMPRSPANMAHLSELRETSRAETPGTTPLQKAAQAQAPAPSVAESEDGTQPQDKAALISELAELARNGGRRNAERVQEEVTLHMERFRDEYADLPI